MITAPWKTENRGKLTAKPLGVFVCLVGFHRSIKFSSRQAFHNLVQSAYPEHVAGSVLSWRSRF